MGLSTKGRSSALPNHPQETIREMNIKKMILAFRRGVAMNINLNEGKKKAVRL